MDREALSARLRSTFIAELGDQVRALNEDLLALEANPANADALRSVFRAAHTVKGAARVAGMPSIEALCHALESLFASVRDEGRELDAPLFALAFSAADRLAEARERLAAGEPPDTAALAAAAARLEEAGAGAPSEPTPPIHPTPPPAKPAPHSPATPAERAEDWVRVPTEQLDELLAATTELMLTANRVTSRLDAADGDARALERTADDLAEAVRRLRLRPFGDACEALPRAVRDVATASGKRARLVVEGEEVEVDRVVIDTLREPLLHLVRNAVDHGIETPEARRAAGKPEEGAVRVAATLTGDRLTVSVADDGAGVDTASVREELASRGRPAPGGNRELARELLRGGASTTREATAISGRGVGLDLAREAMERLGGSIDLRWEAGRGTTVLLETPPSPASLRAVVVEVSSTLFCVPTAHVERLVRLPPERVRQVDGRAIAAGFGDPLPVLSLASALGPPLQPRPLAGPAPALLVRTAAHRAAVLVDALLAEESIVVRPVDALGRAGTPHLAGGALLPNGRVALVLSVATLLDDALASGARAAAPLATPPDGARRRVLVVDDSITTRTLEQSVLEAAGYAVTTAVDGVDAWQRLQEHEVDAVVADVEMPRLNGLALCERIRASERLAGLPVVLVTGLETAEDRARGLEVGADAYLPKSGFDQQALLDTLRQLID